MKRNIVILVTVSIVSLIIGGSTGYLLRQPGGNSDTSSATSSNNGYTSDLKVVSEPLPAPVAVPIENEDKNTKPYTSFSDGIYEVGVDIKPGIYKTEGIGKSCYYARLSSFTGDSNIIDNEITIGPATIEILASDRALKTSGCGVWTMM